LVLGCVEVKTLIFTTKSSENALVMLGGDQAAISGHPKKARGSRGIRLANPEGVLAVTGSIPPFGWQPPFPEATLLPEPLLGVGTGQWGKEILITPTHLITASGAVTVNLMTGRNQPIFPE
jgi:prolyl-tRNA editing enzyme YbaK/EbsC (Cys-tRNA(Pro) deacylase)